MNARYVTVCIPILLLLAGPNHAHGLSTFGRSPTVPPNTSPQIPAKQCTSHEQCKGINGTSCVASGHVSSNTLCLCGNNQAPQNGVCSATKRGAFHMCGKHEDCVPGASCAMNDDKVMVCLCDDYPEGRDCNGAVKYGQPLLALLLIVALEKIFG